jgi:hypothetical protein
VRLPAPGRGPGWSWLPPAALASAVAAAYLVLDFRASDYPAHLFRAELFGREGFTIWSNAWYGGHHLPAYSVLFPPLAWLVGPQLVGALSCVAGAVLFERLVRERFGDRARFGALWFGAGIGSLLFTERLTFALGVAIGLGALLALQRRRPWPAAALAAAASLSSPVAGLFVALAGGSFALAGVRADPASRNRRLRAGLGLAAAALAPIVALNALFPESGEQPFATSAYLGIPLACAAALFLLPVEQRSLRIGALLYVLGATATFIFASPLGANVTRLASLLGGPLLAAAVLGRVGSRARAVVLAVALVALAYWQWAPAVRASLDADGDPSREAAYYEPLLDRLERNPPPGRLEIPFLRSHFEAAYVGERFPLARGWERQLDVERNGLFYDGGLDHAEYAGWLRDNAVSHVAVADAPNDYSAEDERALVDERPSYLTPVWRSEHWRLYRVRNPTPLVAAEDGADLALSDLDDSSFTLRAGKRGAALVRVEWTPYWAAPGACLERAGDWTRVEALRPGPVRVAPDFSIVRIGADGPRCD